MSLAISGFQSAQTGSPILRSGFDDDVDMLSMLSLKLCDRDDPCVSRAVVNVNGAKIAQPV